ncbi:MAG: PHP domain-containing protein, partial [Nitrospinales bacterium]
MDRRSFLKRMTGLTFGLVAVNLALPGAVKCKMISPVTGMVASNFLDDRIKNNIRALKQKHPHLKIGDTHCHSTFSDGTYPIEDLMHRSANLGLDFLIITEHVIPERFALERSLASFRERHRVFLQWNDKQ